MNYLYLIVRVGIVSERPYKDDTIPVSIYQQKLSEKYGSMNLKISLHKLLNFFRDATIKELKDEVVKYATHSFLVQAHSL